MISELFITDFDDSEDQRMQLREGGKPFIPDPEMCKSPNHTFTSICFSFLPAKRNTEIVAFTHVLAELSNSMKI